MRSHLIWLFVPLCGALACGGKFQRNGLGEDASGGVSVGQGGAAASEGGAASRAGTTGKSGSDQGGTASGAGPLGGGATGTFGGASPAGGAIDTAGTVSVGGSCACDSVGCAPGYQLVPNDNDCCYHCEPDPKACDQQLATYLAYRQPLLDKFGIVGCKADTDCGYYYDANRCQARGCGIPLSNMVIGDLSADLDVYAQIACDPSCPPAPVPPCDQALNAVCFNGHCQ